MIQNLILKILQLFDLFHLLKIKKFFQENNLKSFDIIFDVGAHKGESINFFLKNFNAKKIISFEASPINFKMLQNKKNKFEKRFKNTKIIIENIALGSNNENKYFKQFNESSSSTFNEINENSRYFKKKFKLINFLGKEKKYSEIKINLQTLHDYIVKNNLEKIDLIKIDTEGFEYDILLGLKDKIQNVKIVFFEHHYDNMIKKKYTFSDINNLLLNNNFNRIFKIKMPFRRTFEYVYFNKSFKHD